MNSGTGPISAANGARGRAYRADDGHTGDTAAEAAADAGGGEVSA
ncbi:hypothetical protein [Nocardia cyriacigeorgica]|nr:hypothetical protein [Nocardia cyriacigeorgica]